MLSRSYPRLSIEEFGSKLITSEDLDPVYVALHRCPFSFDVLSKWLVAYWCLYHCGAASYLSGLSDSAFWPTLMEAARNVTPAPTGNRWPRSAERRHWRGRQAQASVVDLTRWKSPRDLVSHLRSGPMDFSSVSARVQELRGFGPWIAFKVADMIDRLGMGAVDFDEAGVFMFKDPAKAALILRGKQDGKDYIHHGTKEQQGRAIHEVVTYLVGVFDGLSAPPLYDRPIGLQEVETVLCKWKSHLNGHYPLGKDTCEINEGLVDWLPHSDNAGKFYLNMVKERDDGGKERKQQSAPAAGAATAG